MQAICSLYVGYMLAISKVYQRQVMSRSKILYSMANANHKSYATSEWRWKRHLSVTAASVGSADWKDTNITDPESGRPLQLMGHSFRVLAVDGVLSRRSFRPTVTERRRLQRLLMLAVRFLRDAFGFRSGFKHLQEKESWKFKVEKKGIQNSELTINNLKTIKNNLWWIYPFGKYKIVARYMQGICKLYVAYMLAICWLYQKYIKGRWWVGRKFFIQWQMQITNRTLLRNDAESVTSQ